jgi:hypothetical protein
MRENETSFQAGEPTPPAPDGPEEALAIAGPSQLDRMAEAIKAYELWGLALAVALQLLVLVAMMMMGTAEMFG